ncbi:MAG: DUF1559 domain-containing protein [Rubinisphaera brasiliensis]|uniref:DUF1559 domain-containing protein n=1 Tax=Rubinisphaera brasiliensis TaxID=119 RepID=UPI00391A265A
MSTWGRRGIVSAYTIAAVGLVGAASWAMTALWQPGTEPASLLPSETFFVATVDGSAAHADAYKKTAEYDAFYESGLADLFTKMIDFAVEQDNSGNAEKIREAANDLLSNGAVVGSFLPEGNPPIPGVVIVLKDNAKWFRPAVNLLEQGLDSQRISAEKVTIEGRSVVRWDLPNSPGIEMGLWQDGGHMVLAVGQNAVKTSIESAAGKRPSLLKNERFQQIASQETDFTQNSLVWLDWQLLQKTYGDIPIPVPNGKQLSVADVLKFVGLDKMDHAVARGGYKGAALWSEATIGGLSGNPSGVLTLKDLPPLPESFTSFSAMHVDTAGFYNKLTSMSQEVASFAGENERDQVDQILESLPQMLGFDPKADVFDHFGNVLCAYDDARGGLFGMGSTVCLSLKDSDAVAEFISSQMDRLEKAEEDGNYPDWPVYPLRVEQGDDELIIFDLREDGGDSIQMGALRVVGDWLVLSVMPQSIAAFEMRLNDELPSWKADGEYAEAMAELPKEFSTITVINTRNSYQLLLTLGTTALPFIQQAILQSDFMEDVEELPFYVEDFPPAERVTHPLFPNVSVSVPGEDGIKFISRASTFGVPMQGSSSSVSSAATVGVLTALLLPAVQSARQAARRSQSKNNLKQMGLAMHNYYDTFRELPRGTVPNEKLKPEQRLAWTYSILPFIEQAALYEGMDKDAAWNKGPNQAMSEVHIPVFINPNQGDDPGRYGQTHYAGIAGVGKDAPKLGVNDKGAGMFGYDRKVTFRDVTDGLSNTMMITEINDNYGPWSQGGKSTLRSLTKKPYINGPDGIGSPGQRDTVEVLLGDGSVRSISENIDPEVFEAMSTIRGGEVIDNF